MSARRLVVLCNPTAGSGRAARALEGVESALRAGGVEVRCERTESARHATELARDAALAGEEIVAFGGDGMVRLAAAAIRGTDAVLGILPGGRGNDFARSLDIPGNPLAACAVLLDDDALRTVDVGDVNGETFVGIASIGLESEVTRLANAWPRVGGRAVYGLATVIGLLRWRPARFDLVVDGTPFRFTGYLAAAANSGRFGGGMRLAPAAALDDGLLDLVAIEHGPKARFVLDTPKLFRGTHVRDPRVHILRVREVRMNADRPFDVYADGDRLAATPAIVRVAPGALHVRAPTRR